MTKRGRPRKANVPREPSGRVASERAAKADWETRIGYRALHLAADGFPGLDPISPLSGTLLGRLRLSGQITGRQYQAGDAWAGIVRRHSAIMGYSLGSKSSSFEMVSFGIPCVDEPDNEAIAEIRDRFRICYDALMVTCKDYGMAVRDATYAVCIEGRAPASYLSLRLGLNTIANALTGYRKSDKEPRESIRGATCA